MNRVNRKVAKGILAIDEERRLLNWTHQNRSFRDYIILLTILRTGLDTTELRELLLSDISINEEMRATLEVQARIASDRKPRTIPIPNDLREQLKAFLEWKQQQGESTEPTSFLFTSAKSPQIALRHLQRIVRESTVSALGVPYRIQDLRRVPPARRQTDAETTFSDVKRSTSEPSPTFSTGADASLRQAGSLSPFVETIQPKQGVWRTYDVTNGLPGGVRCVLQDHQGYLWLGTLAGLCC